MAFVIVLSGGPISWKAHKEQRISRSSCEAEIKATDECTKSVQWTRHLLDDLGACPDEATPIYNDNRGCIDWTKGQANKKLRHMNIREFAVREAVQEFHEVDPRHMSGKLNPSDIFTKEHKSDQIFRELRDSFMTSRRSYGGCQGPRGADLEVTSSEVETSCR